MTLDVSTQLAATLGDLGTRVRLGANPATPAATLSALAQDAAVTVRAAVALNSAASHQTDQHLAGDPDERVRMLLARKVLAVLPDRSEADQERLSGQTVTLLLTLVEDEALRIRVLVAEVLAGLAGIPHDLILLLAHASDVPVSEPVLRLSPLLSAADLLALLHDPPHEAVSRAIAGRADLPADAADFIAASADNAAIRELLANPSASIRESTLDALIARAHDRPEWQEPLVRRPTLPPHAAHALSEIISNQWLQVLMDRPDFPAGLKSQLRQRLWARLAGEHHLDSANADDAMMHAARQLSVYGQLDESVLQDAVQAGDGRRAAAILAVAVGLPLEAVDRAATMRSAKALVSLVWKAGFSMQTAITIQALLGRLGPAGILRETEQGFPLGIEEMGWQLDLLIRAGW